MPKLNFLAPDNPTQSIDQNQAKLVNMYLEPDKSLGQFQLIAYPLPGLVTFCNTNENNVRTLLTYNNTVYVVAGNKFGSINSGGTFTQLGNNLSTSSGFAKIVSITGGSDINNQLIIIDGTNGYSYNLDTATATFPISDVDFPQTASDITAQDDYVIVANNNSIQFNVSNLADSTTWAALDFASKIGYSDNVVALKSFKSKLWIYGNKTIEVWYNSGNADFPFERYSDVSITYGLAAKESLIVVNDTQYLLAQSEAGGYHFMNLVDYAMVPIGDSSHESLVDAMTTVSDCKTYAYTYNRHDFIDWVFPTANKTFTYDITTGSWSERQSNNSGTYGRFLGNCSAFCYSKRLIGDFNSGKIYTQDFNTYQENSTDIRRIYQSPPFPHEGRRIFIHRAQIYTETGIGDNKTFTLEVSNDSGRTWEIINTYTIPSDNTTQLYTSSLGSGFNWMFRIITTMNAKFILLGFVIEYTTGVN